LRSGAGRGGFLHRGHRLALGVGDLAGVPQGLIQRVQVEPGGAHLLALGPVGHQGGDQFAVELRRRPGQPQRIGQRGAQPLPLGVQAGRGGFQHRLYQHGQRRAGVVQFEAQAFVFAQTGGQGLKRVRGVGHRSVPREGYEARFAWIGGRASANGRDGRRRGEGG